MQSLWTDEVRIMAAGAAGALVLGLTLGAVMQPDLNVDYLGPQVMTPVSGVRADNTFDPAVTFASYGAKVPDYVIGTDWVKAMQARNAPYPVTPVAYEPEYAVAADDHVDTDAETAATAPLASVYEYPAAEVTYRSVSGGAPDWAPRVPVAPTAAVAPSAPMAEHLASYSG